MIAILQLIRFPNLLIIAATQYLVRWCLIKPLLPFNAPLLLNEFEFFLVVFSTILIAAAGYAINDYFDTRIDRVNKPERVVVNNVIDRRLAMALHIVMNFLALAIALYLAWIIGKTRMVLIQGLAITFLWFYSVDLKHRFLTGNLVIAALAFLVPVLPAMYELTLQTQAHGDTLSLMLIKLREINYLVIGYGVFAFLTNLVREIIKDMEDLDGDSQYGSRTIPITIGINATKWVAAGLVALTISLLFYLVMMRQVEEGLIWPFLYFLVAVQIPLLVILYFLFKADDKKDFGRLSIWIKAVMLGGIISMPVHLLTVEKIVAP